MNTRQLNQLLNQTFTIPVVIQSHTFPNDQPYQSIANLDATGFSFTGKELLHALGCKIAALPASNKDESIRAAYMYACLLDFNGQYLGYKQGINIDSDLQTNRSNEIGIGLGCLIANKHFNVDWDTLEPIKGKGKRFDYRATIGNQDHAYEFKGTKHKGKQEDQIRNGISKKTDMHARNEHYDVELIISTNINYSNYEPRIILADPPFSGYKDAFTEDAELFYKLRHYSRIAQFLGNIPLSRALYMQSQVIWNQPYSNDQIDELGYKTYQSERNILKNQKALEKVITTTVDGRQLHGQWVANWIPEDGNVKRQSFRLPRISPNGELEIFQGVTSEVYDTMLSTESGKIRSLSQNYGEIGVARLNNEFDLFEDGTVMSYKIRP